MQFLDLAGFTTPCQPKWIIVERWKGIARGDGGKCSFMCGTVIRNIRETDGRELKGALVGPVSVT